MSVDALMAQVRYDLGGDQMRAMWECDDETLRELFRELIALRHTVTTIAGSFGCDELVDDLPALAQAMIAHSGTYDLLHEEVQQYRAAPTQHARADR